MSVSQSGQSPDIVALQETARQAGALSIAVVNDPESRLAAGADIVVPLQAGIEQSVAATKTCLASAAALAGIAAAWSQNAQLQAALHSLPAALATARDLSWDGALPHFAAAQSAYTLGRGPALPIAAEAALKLKETSALHAEAFSSAEVLHGPLQLLQPGFPVLAFTPKDAAFEAMQASIARLGEAGGRVFSVSPGFAGGTTLPAAETGHPPLDSLPMLLSFYRFAEALSRQRGFDPDRPSLLSKVTKTV